MLARSILGTEDPAEVFGRLAVFLAGHGSPAIRRTLFCGISVGAAFGLSLADGSSVVLKAHPAEREVVVAGDVYAMAYGARCEHALDPEGENLAGGFREALRGREEEYLRLGTG